MHTEYPAPNHFIVHISDTHLIGEGDNLYGSKSTPEKNLKKLFQKLDKANNTPEAIIFTGDLADMGEPEAYKKIMQIVEPAAQKMGTQLIWAMGNHDNREHFREILLKQNPSQAPVDHVTTINGLRIITLDTTVLGHHYGAVDDEQLHWLENILQTPNPEGTILAMHHPPIPSVLDLAATVELKNQKALANVLRGKDIKAIIAGHLHYSSSATFAGIPVSVASATCYTQDLNVEKGGTRGRNGSQGFNFIHIYDETIVHSVVPLNSNATVGKFVSAKETQEILSLEKSITNTLEPQLATTT